MIIIIESTKFWNLIQETKKSTWIFVQSWKTYCFQQHLWQNPQCPPLSWLLCWLGSPSPFPWQSVPWPTICLAFIVGSYSQYLGSCYHCTWGVWGTLGVVTSTSLDLRPGTLEATLSFMSSNCMSFLLPSSTCAPGWRTASFSPPGSWWQPPPFQTGAWLWC